MGRTPNTTAPVEGTEPEQATGVTPITEAIESEGGQRLEALDPAAQAGVVSPADVKNDATADSTLEGADTPQIEDEAPLVAREDADTPTDADLAAAVAAADQEQAKPSGPKTHTVKQGETSGDISEKFDVDYITLGKLNPGLNLHSLLAGDVVTLRAD